MIETPLLDTGVNLRPGAIAVNTVSMVVDDPHAKVYLVDCSSKYFDTHRSLQGDSPGVSLTATSDTLNLDPNHPVNAATVLTFPDLDGCWSVLVDGGRYEATIALWRVDPARDTGSDIDGGADTLGVDRSNAARFCGDYPAPCNCDDPETHTGRH